MKMTLMKRSTKLTLMRQKRKSRKETEQEIERFEELEQEILG